MRLLLVLLGFIVLAVAVLMAIGMIDIDQTRDAALPSIRIEGGQAPQFRAEVGRIDLGTENRTVAMPRIDVEKPGDAPAP